MVVAEGIETPDKERPSVYVTRVIEEATGIESRDTVLGYIQRGGNPSPFDRNLATRLGGHATELIANRQFGRMVCMKGSEVESIPLSEVAGKLKLVTPEHDLIIQGNGWEYRSGINFQREQLLCLFPLFFSLYLLFPVPLFSTASSGRFSNSFSAVFSPVFFFLSSEMNCWNVLSVRNS